MIAYFRVLPSRNSIPIVDFVQNCFELTRFTWTANHSAVEAGEAIRRRNRVVQPTVRPLAGRDSPMSKASLEARSTWHPFYAVKISEALLSGDYPGIVTPPVDE